MTACTDQVVGDILSGWRYDISGISPEMRTDYESHLAMCDHCRSRQRLHRTIDVVLIGISTLSILSIGFLIASIVPTARFAQPIGAAILYPMIAVSGLFTPISSMPPVLHAVARVLPMTYAVSLLEGMWRGDAWSAHLGDVAALAVVFFVCTALSAKVFRWE